jgi:hypothetical protein
MEQQWNTCENGGKNLFLIFLGLFVCCTSKNVKKEEDYTVGRLTFSIEVVDSLLKEERICIDKKERIISYTDTIDYTGEINQIIFGKDTITYTENLKGRKSVTLFNNESLQKYTLQNSQYTIDSMDLVFDLNLLEIYYLKNNDNIIIIKTTPMNWVGRMTSFCFFQLINLKEKTVVEFIREEKLFCKKKLY